MRSARLEIWTVGHSNRSLDEFVKLLCAHAIEAVADVRRFPGSRRHPHFHERALRESLAAVRAEHLDGCGIEYHAFRELGGRRKALPDSRNTAWRNAGFRGYADYMETPEFRTGMERLRALAGAERTAILCAEALWWRCHRGLIADYLKADGCCVRHILSPSKAEEHPYTSAARLVNGRLTYGADEPRLF